MRFHPHEELAVRAAIKTVLAELIAFARAERFESLVPLVRLAAARVEISVREDFAITSDDVRKFR